jgi:hypothetical protein
MFAQHLVTFRTCHIVAYPAIESDLWYSVFVAAVRTRDNDAVLNHQSIHSRS